MIKLDYAVQSNEHEEIITTMTMTKVMITTVIMKIIIIIIMMMRIKLASQTKYQKVKIE